MATKKAAKKTRRTASNAPAQATVRFYCQGIGDCHLLRFDKDDGDPFWMLIDCGIHTSISGGREKVDAIVEDIASITDRLDVVVGTHEHWDHLSGFHTARDAFANITVGEVWLGWTENPDDDQAQALDKFKGKALAALQGAQVRLAGVDTPHLAAVRDGVDSLMGFQFGLEGEKVRAARDALEAMATKKVRYLEPSKPPLTLPGLPNLRIYVLGPPRDEDLIKVRERKSEMYGLGAATARAEALISAIQSEDDVGPDDAAPFEPNMGTDLSALLGARPRRTTTPRNAAATCCTRTTSAPPSAESTPTGSAPAPISPSSSTTARTTRVSCSPSNSSTPAACCCSRPTRKSAIGSAGRTSRGAAATPRSLAPTSSRALCC